MKEPTKDEIKQLIRKCIFDIKFFVREMIIDPYNKARGTDVFITRQQGEALEELQKLVLDKIAGKRHDILGISIMSGKGTGKDACTAWVIMWFMFCFENPKIPCVSVTADQLDKVLWAEITKWFETSRLRDFFTLQADKFYRKDVDPDVRGKRWFAFKKAANPRMSQEEQLESLAGIHEDFLLQVLDEVSGIPNVVPEKLEENMTQDCNLMWMIFNPMHAKGYAVDSQYSKSHRWIALRWNAEESEITNKIKHKGIEEDYGRNSNPYRMSVLGLPPVTDEKTLIPWEWIQDAIDRELQILPTMRLVSALDCGAGGDNSIIASRRGNKLFPFRKFSSDDPVKLENWAGNYIDTEEPDLHRVDTVGIGWAIGGNLEQKKGLMVQSCDSRRNADNPEMFMNKRAEMFWNLREQFRKGAVSIPDDPDFKNQLSVLKFDTNEKGQIFIMKKKDIKKELGGASPNEADAAAMLFYEDDNFVSMFKGYKQPELNYEGTWMY